MIPSVKPQAENEPKQAWMIALVAVATAATVYAVTAQQKAQKEGAKEAKKLAQQQMQQMAEQQQLQLQAGEYWEELSEKQMALQQSENRFKTLADLLLQKVKKQKEEGQEILTTPATPAATKEPSFVEKINQSIDKFLKG